MNKYYLNKKFFCLVISFFLVQGMQIHAQDLGYANKRCLDFGFQERTKDYDECVKLVLQASGPVKPTSKPAAIQTPSQPLLDEKFWDGALAAGNKEGFEAYLNSYPKGRYAELARANLLRLSNASSDQRRLMQWVSIMGYNPSQFLSCGSKCPVENVSWNDVQNFIEKLNLKTGKKFRLPTEWEWEYYARAGSTSTWIFGEDETRLGDYAWYAANSEYKTQPVAQKMPNAFGLYDVLGNVWEWTQDCWHMNYDRAPSNGSSWSNLCSNNSRVIRGGSSSSRNADIFRSDFRNADRPDSRRMDVGFRLARDL